MFPEGGPFHLVPGLYETPVSVSFGRRLDPRPAQPGKLDPEDAHSAVAEYVEHLLAVSLSTFRGLLAVRGSPRPDRDPGAFGHARTWALGSLPSQCSTVAAQAPMLVRRLRHTRLSPPGCLRAPGEGWEGGAVVQPCTIAPQRLAPPLRRIVALAEGTRGRGRCSRRLHMGAGPRS